LARVKTSYGGKGDFGRPFLFVRLRILNRSPEQMRAQVAEASDIYFFKIINSVGSGELNFLIFQGRKWLHKMSKHVKFIS
jgi:hypothetical protein